MASSAEIAAERWGLSSQDQNEAYDAGGASAVSGDEWDEIVVQSVQPSPEALDARQRRVLQLLKAARRQSAAKATPPPAKESAMSDPLTRDELAARLDAVEARTDTKFEKLFSEIKEARSASVKEVAVLTSDLRGDIRTMKAEIAAQLSQTAGQKTVWGAVATAVGVILFGVVATILVFGQITQTAYDTGINAEQRATEAAQAAAERLAASEPPLKREDQTRRPG